MARHIDSRFLKIQTAVAEAATARIVENVLRDIHPGKAFELIGVQLWVREEATSLHEVTLYRNRSTGPGPVSGATDPVEYEGQFFAWVEHTVGDHNVYYNFPEPIDFDKTDNLTVRFDTGTQGAGESCAMEICVLYVVK